MPKEILAAYLVLSIEIHPNQEKAFRTEYGTVLAKLYQAIASNDKTQINFQIKQLKQAAQNSYISFGSALVAHYPQEKVADANTFKLVLELDHTVPSSTQYTELLNNENIVVKQVSLLSQTPTPVHSHTIKPETAVAINHDLQRANSLALKKDSQRLQDYTDKINTWLKTLRDITIYSAVLPSERRQAIPNFMDDLKNFDKLPGYNISTAEQLLQEVVNFCHLVHGQINAQLDRVIKEQADWIAQVVTEANVNCLSNDKLQTCNQLLGQAEATKQLELAKKAQLATELTSFNQTVFPLLQAKHSLDASASQQVAAKPVQPKQVLVEPAHIAPGANKQKTPALTSSTASVTTKPSLVQRLGNWLVVAKNWLAGFFSSAPAKHIESQQTQPIPQQTQVVYHEPRFTPGRSIFCQKQLIIQNASLETDLRHSATNQPG
jgi:hypothetical protein